LQAARAQKGANRTLGEHAVMIRGAAFQEKGKWKDRPFYQLPLDDKFYKEAETHIDVLAVLHGVRHLLRALRKR
jgi:hypothetical protein